MRNQCNQNSALCAVKDERQTSEAIPEVHLVCNNCDVTMVFCDPKNQRIRNQVADLLVTAFERQIGVREAV